MSLTSSAGVRNLLSRFPLLALAAAALLPGCFGSKRYFSIRSYPQGAVIYVDDEPRGQTDFQRLAVDFGDRDTVTVRVIKDGYQPEGQVLDSGSPRDLVFFLEEAPRSGRFVEELTAIHRALDRLADRLAERLEGGEDETLDKDALEQGAFEEEMGDALQEPLDGEIAGSGDEERGGDRTTGGESDGTSQFGAETGGEAGEPVSRDGGGETGSEARGEVGDE